VATVTGPVPLTRLDGGADPELLEELLEAVRRIATSGAFTLGSEVAAFEDELAAFCGTAHAVGVGSGIDALLLSLLALGVGPGDDVVVPANTFIATAEAVALAGARVRVCDVDPVSGLMTPETLAPALTPAVRAVIPVHLHGRTADVAAIAAVCAPAAVLEDACQAHGARHGGRRAGALGTAGCFSFYPAKNLGAWGDGGAMVTDDAALADEVRLRRAHGERRRYEHELVGTTSRLDAVHAAVLRVKLRRLEAANDARRALAAAYDAALDGAGGIELPARPAPGADHVWHQYVVRCERRDAVRAALAAAGIASGIHYPVCVHRQPAFAHLRLGPGTAPVAEDLAGRILSLPMFPIADEAGREALAAAMAEAVHRA
jgi:dTDP-4-amino-4,6-dideoxygalactose transaminase